MIDNDCIKKAIETIEQYITQTTGERPEPQEIAKALTRYFVLKEIHDFIELDRQENIEKIIQNKD